MVTISTGWLTAIYIRLSKEDEKTRTYGGESESIGNQRNLLLSYLRDNNLTAVKEYVDDGVSGTTFDRPHFNEMIKDIEAGRINMVITKDLSRLGRDYIQSGYYIEQYFPAKNVRYISLLDNIDTFLDNSSNDIAPFKSILNDMYSKDISKKIRSVLKSKKEQGKFLGKTPPYGYQKDPENKHRLIVDEDAKLVVGEIFKLFLSGHGTCQIATILSERHVPIPSVHNKLKVGCPGKSYGLWSNTGVSRILRNEVYTGVLVQNKYRKLNYKSKKLVKTDPSLWIRTDDSHESIISRDVFDRAQRLLAVNQGLRPSKHRYLLSGLLHCYDCGASMSIAAKDKKYGRVYGRCNRYIKYHKFNLCTTHSFNYNKLEEYVLTLLRGLCEKYCNTSHMGSILERSRDKRHNPEMRIKNEIRRLEQRIETLYEDRLNGIIQAVDFKRLSDKANTERESLQKQLKSFCEIPKIDREQIIKEFLTLANPTQSILAELIDRIDVHENGEFDIHFKFQELQSVSNFQKAT